MALISLSMRKNLTRFGVAAIVHTFQGQEGEMSFSHSLDRNKHARAIRIAIHDLGFWIGALFIGAQAASWSPEYRPYAIGVGVGMCLWMWGERYKDWKAIDFVETKQNPD
jgi:hypothetical protein